MCKHVQTAKFIRVRQAVEMHLEDSNTNQLKLKFNKFKILGTYTRLHMYEFKKAQIPKRTQLQQNQEVLDTYRSPDPLKQFYIDL